MKYIVHSTKRTETIEANTFNSAVFNFERDFIVEGEKIISVNPVPDASQPAIKKWKTILQNDLGKNITYGYKVLQEMVNDFESASQPAAVPDEAGEVYSRKQLEDAHIVGYTKGRLAEQDSDSIYQDAVNYAATISPAPPSGELTINDYKEVIEDNKRLVRELDILLNGENTAKQASLCDIVAQLKTAPPIRRRCGKVCGMVRK